MKFYFDIYVGVDMLNFPIYIRIYTKSGTNKKKNW